MSSSFSKFEVVSKNKTGTWLSPIPQPEVEVRLVNPPLDKKLRNYLGAAALALPELIEECQKYQKLLPQEARTKLPLRENQVVRDVPCTPDREMLPSEIQFKPDDNGVTAARFRWHEDVILHGVGEHIVVIQVRAHTKAELHHDVARPVYCINLKTYHAPHLNLRYLALLSPEVMFAEEAAKHFAKESDAHNGSIIFDQVGRVWIDEQVVKRAAYRYSRFQIERTATGTAPVLTDEVRYSHFLVHRSHMPHLPFDAEKKRYIIPENNIQEAA